MGKIVIRLRLHIRQIAEKRGMTRTRLSRLADVNYRTIQDLWADEIKDAQVSTLVKIARVLKVPITDLFTAIDVENE